MKAISNEFINILACMMLAWSILTYSQGAGVYWLFFLLLGDLFWMTHTKDSRYAQIFLLFVSLFVSLFVALI